MDMVKSLVQPLIGNSGGSSIVDGMKLVVLGGTVETARRVSSSAWSHFVNSFFLTAHFSEEDFPYEWLMLWLSRRPEWQRSREFETTTRAGGPGGNNANYYSEEDADWDRWERAESDGLDPDSEGRPRTRVMFQPTYDTTHNIFYRGHWLRIRRGRKPDTCSEMISISVVARSNAILKQLVLQAKKEYEAEAVHRIQIYFADAHGSWRWTDSRHKRPLSSIVLNPGVKEMLVDDARDFLKSEKWYADRGIPFRRGYLLHGVPGSGKSSLIHALAGQLQLDIYVVSLSASWISDNTLTALMGRVPARCVLLLEDLDAAFLRSTNREEDDLGLELENGDNQQNSNDNLFPGFSNNLSSVGYRGGRRRYGTGLSDVNTLSLSGLLNALDGVAASEGRLLFATTNHLDRLDPALCRPGRLDVWVEFKNASKWQAEALFRNFFPCEEEEDAPISEADLDMLNIDANVRTYVPTEDPGEKVPDSRAKGHGNRKSGVPSLWSLSTNLASSASSLLSTSIPSSGMSSGVTSPTLNSPSEVSAPPLPRTLSGPPVPDASASIKADRPPMDKDQFGATNTAYLPPPPDASLSKPKPLDRKTLAVLAKRFADGIPEEEFSVASLQGYLLKHKAQPEGAADGVISWVEGERVMREKLKKEREARELKMKALREKRQKEHQEKEKQKKAQDKKEQELEKVKKLLAEKEKEEELEKMRQQLKEKEEERRKKRKEKKKGKSKSKDKEETKEKEESGSQSEDEKEAGTEDEKDKTKAEEEAKEEKSSKKKAKKDDKKSDDKKEKKASKDDAKKDDSSSASSSSSDSDDKEDKEDDPKKTEADEVASTASSDDFDPTILSPLPQPKSKWGAIPASDGWSSSDSSSVWGRS